jgi:hypothetical protein
MPEHFTKNTVEATFRCPKCNKDTPHQVFDGRRGGCLVCINQPRLIEEPAQPEQLTLAQVYGTVEIK